MKSAYRILVRGTVRCMYRWDNNNKMNLKEIECEHMDWIHLVQDRVQGKSLVDMVMNLQAVQKMGDFLNN
jgi:hypothetical protein